VFVACDRASVQKTDLESCHLYNIHSITMPTNAEKTKIVIVSKTGSLTETNVETNKETTLDELTTILSKKCANKKSDGFSCYHTYKYKNKKKGAGAIASSYLYIDVWCRTDGRAGQENKYELPPPIDEIIFFGNIALVARIDAQSACDLSIELWNKIYEKLFGGFEDLAATAKDDENEIDELAFVPASKKTANGYLKDGFIVDDSPSSSDLDGDKPKKSKTIKSDSTTTESEFVTETETDSISDTDSTSSSDRKITPSIKKTVAVSVSTSAAKKKPTKKDELARSTAAAAAAAAVAAILGDSCDSELSEDSYS
jgi:hypothetical protein